MTVASSQPEGIEKTPPPDIRPVSARKFPKADLLIMVALLAVIAVVLFNVYFNMRAAGIQPGFSFLLQQSGFDLSESILPYTAESSYLSAVFAGLLNTVAVSIVSLVLASLIGLVIALISVSPSAAARYLALGYVELFRNLPKILILLVLFVLSVNGLPSVRHALTLGPILVSNRAFYFPGFVVDPRQLWLIPALMMVLALCIVWRRQVEQYQASTGLRKPLFPVWGAIALFGFSATVFGLDIPLRFSLPTLVGFNVRGGISLSLQFGAVALTLGLYHGAQIAEVLRGGIYSIPKGQYEASYALGLPSRRIFRLIVIPQVLRIVIPPLNNQFVNLIKNTSIAIAIGYSDLMSVSGTIINQTFRPLEVMIITMVIYLLLCLALAGALNAWNEKIRHREGRTGV